MESSAKYFTPHLFAAFRRVHPEISLQLTVVAEGIETNSQYQILKQQGYHVAQGYLFSRALAAKDLEAWLHTATLSP